MRGTILVEDKLVSGFLGLNGSPLMAKLRASEKRSEHTPAHLLLTRVQLHLATA